MTPFAQGGFLQLSQSNIQASPHLIFLALHGSTNGTVYEFVHAFSALCGVIFYYLLLPLRDKNVYALNFCAISGGVFFIALIAWHLLLDLPYLWAGGHCPPVCPVSHYDKIFAVLFKMALAVLVHKLLLRAGRDVKVYRFANLVIHQHNGCVHAYFSTVYVYHVFHF